MLHISIKGNFLRTARRVCIPLLGYEGLILMVLGFFLFFFFALPSDSVRLWDELPWHERLSLFRVFKAIGC